MQLFVIFLLCASFLVSCSNADYEKKLLIAKEKSSKTCYIAPKNLPEDQDWLVAKLYFPADKVSITAKDMSIIKQIVDIYYKCGNDILIIAHAGQIDTNSDVFLHPLDVSYQRGNNVYKYFTTLNFRMKDNVHMLFCSNNNNVVDIRDSSNKDLDKFNNRVEIVFLNSTITSHNYDCLKNIFH